MDEIEMLKFVEMNIWSWKLHTTLERWNHPQDCWICVKQFGCPNWVPFFGPWFWKLLMVSGLCKLSLLFWLMLLETTYDIWFILGLYIRCFKWNYYAFIDFQGLCCWIFLRHRLKISIGGVDTLTSIVI